ncbi:hypothetical protein [Streptomyces sp. NPDC056061]|uniref:hypothetical protein n=1 Tax=Streptomyces sp. NPDC056061 TaxID=3345700 RepID=UPI0035D79B8C
MTRLHVRTGIDPDEPDVPVVTLVVDPGGSPGERAVARLGNCCYEGDGVFFLSQTDGWGEHTLAHDRLVVDIAVYPVVLERNGVDTAAFPGRSAVDPEAALVLRAETTVDPEVFARADSATVVFVAGPDQELDDVLGRDDDWPMLLASPPAP